MPYTCLLRPPDAAPSAALPHTAGELLNANAALVMELARPFGAAPTIENLIHLRPGQDVGRALLAASCCPALLAAAASLPQRPLSLRRTRARNNARLGPSLPRLPAATGATLRRGWPWRRSRTMSMRPWCPPPSAPSRRAAAGEPGWRLARRSSLCCMAAAAGAAADLQRQPPSSSSACRPPASWTPGCSRRQSGWPTPGSSRRRRSSSTASPLSRREVGGLGCLFEPAPAGASDGLIACLHLASLPCFRSAG